MTGQQYNMELACAYSQVQQNPHQLNALVYQTWLARLGNVHDLRVLDLACGSGHTSRLLAQAGAIVTGVDVSSDMLSIANAQELANPLGITYICENAGYLNLGTSFDVVSPSFLLHYAPSKEELAAFIETIAHHLVSGGHMVALNTPPDPIVPLMQQGSHWTEWVNPAKAFEEGAEVRLHLLGPDGHKVCDFVYYYWSRETYEELLSTFGFTNIQWISHSIPLQIRKEFPNWEELQRYTASCVLAAIKK